MQPDARVRPFPKSEQRDDVLRALRLIAALVALSIAVNAAGIIAMMSAASDLSGQ